MEANHRRPAPVVGRQSCARRDLSLPMPSLKTNLKFSRISQAQAGTFLTPLTPLAKRSPCGRFLEYRLQ